MRSSDSFRNNSESFSPVCLPRFNAGAFVYAYVAFLELESSVCLVLLSTQPDSFHALAEARAGVEAGASTRPLLSSTYAVFSVSRFVSDL